METNMPNNDEHVQRALEGLARLLKLAMRKLSSQVIYASTLNVAVNEFSQALVLLHSPNRHKYALPSILHKIWHLAILDTEYYGYVCWYAVRKYGRDVIADYEGENASSYGGSPPCPLFIPYDPLEDSGESLKVRRQTLESAFFAKYKRSFHVSVQMGNEITLLIKTIAGKHFSVRCPIGAPVSYLDSLIKSSIIVPHHLRWLMFSGKPLDEDKTLEEHGIKADSTIHVMLRGFLKK
ncbi:hypothetical protein BC829DRAFT_380606 [Chytridium lagenaria]|nr:hypothetical protein BC829DRAFT_380606 [Chytridium lagenaria]